MSDDAQNRAFDEPKDDEEGGPPSPEDRHVSHLLAWAAIMLQVLSMAPPRASDLWGSGHVEGNLLDTRLDEISGLAFDATGRYLWAHNDSGDTPRLFALTRAGELASTRPLRTPYLEDVEAIAAGPCAPGQSRRCLFVADIGDNRHQRDHVHIVRIPAPEDPGAEGALTPDHVMHLRHPGGPHDAESMLLDPMSGRLWIVEKSREGPTRALAVPERGLASPRGGRPSGARARGDGRARGRHDRRAARHRRGHLPGRPVRGAADLPALTHLVPTRRGGADAGARAPGGRRAPPGDAPERSDRLAPPTASCYT